jgi:hypothetical protein
MEPEINARILAIEITATRPDPMYRYGSASYIG